MKKRLLRYLVRFAVVAAVVVIAFALLNWRASVVLKRQYDSAVAKPHTSAEMRGLVNGIVAMRDAPPAFLAQHLWDQEMCSATIVTAVNFIAGVPVLTDGPAWKFGQTNALSVELVYDRSPDFRIEAGPKGPRVVEVQDTAVKLSSILRYAVDPVTGTTDRMFIIGYHYRATRSDGHIVEARAGLNSHLMLLLGKDEHQWWGYHMFHGTEDKEFPFRVDSLKDDMPDDFDLVYIWELKGLRMSRNGEPVAFVQNLSPYPKIRRWLGTPFDRVYMYLWGDADQFPRMVTATDGAVFAIAADDAHLRPGAVLGYYHGVAVRNHGEKSRRGAFGLEYQCVELANRFLAQALDHQNLTRSGDAESYFYRAAEKGLTAFAQGGVMPPRPDDLLVFDRDGTGGDPGHIAVITEVTDRKVCVVHQNAWPWRTCQSLENVAGGWRVEAFNDNLPCIGWVRAPYTDAHRETSAKVPERTPSTLDPKTQVIRRVHVDNGKTVRQYVAETPGANLRATFACNEWSWENESRHKIYHYQVFRICSW